MQGSNRARVRQVQTSLWQIRNKVRIERFHNLEQQRQARLYVVAASANIVRKVISFTERIRTSFALDLRICGSRFARKWHGWA